MRFSVLFTLLVATFVVSSDSFISAETYSLADQTYDSTEISHLRGNGDLKEEREAIAEAAAHGAGLVRPSASPNYVPKTADEIAGLAKKINEKHNLQKLNNKDLAKLMAELAVVKQDDKEKWSMAKKVFLVVLAGAGISFALYALYELLTPYGA